MPSYQNAQEVETLLEAAPLTPGKSASPHKSSSSTRKFAGMAIAATALIAGVAGVTHATGKTAPAAALSEEIKSDWMNPPIDEQNPLSHTASSGWCVRAQPPAIRHSPSPSTTHHPPHATYHPPHTTHYTPPAIRHLILPTTHPHPGISTSRPRSRGTVRVVGAHVTHQMNTSVQGPTKTIHQLGTKLGRSPHQSCPLIALATVPFLPPTFK